MMFVIVSPIASGFPSRFTLRIVAMELPPLLVYRVRRSLRWREEDDQPQVLRDGMKPMRQSGRREYDAARLHRTVLVVNPNHGSAADDVVVLARMVRPRHHAGHLPPTADPRPPPRCRTPSSAIIAGGPPASPTALSSHLRTHGRTSRHR